MKTASNNFTFPRPLIFLRQRDNKSIDSLSTYTHGGLWYLLQLRQKFTKDYFVIPSVISYYYVMQLTHMFVFDTEGVNIIPHIQH